VLPDTAAAEPPLRRLHADRLRDNLPGSQVSAWRRVGAGSPDDASPWRPAATDEQLARVKSWRLADGRFLDAEDVRRGARTAVVAEAAALEAGVRAGDTIRLGGEPFVVAGLVAGAASMEETGLPSANAWVPLDAPLGDVAETGPRGRIDAIFVRGPGGAGLDAALRAAGRLLDQPPAPAGPWQAVTPDSLLDGVKKLQRLLWTTAGGVTLLCLLLGGTTLMSLLIASVQDRLAEIGLRRALGATPLDVAGLFVWEALLLTAVSGLAGAGLAAGLLAALRPQLPLPVDLSPAPILLPVAAVLLLGALFSYAPARLAARLAPSDALRNQ
jgi:putative ABC transport system permease protein